MRKQGMVVGAYRHAAGGLVPAVLAVVLLSLPSSASDLLVSFDVQGTVAEKEIEPYTPYSLYVIGQGIGQVTGFQIRVEISPLYTVLSRQVSYNHPFPPVDDNWILGLGACFGTPGEDFIFITYSIGYFLGETVPEDETVCLKPPMIGSEQTPLLLAYVNCQNELVELELGNIGCTEDMAGCAVLNPMTPCLVETSAISWSSVKSLF